MRGGDCVRCIDLWMMMILIKGRERGGNEAEYLY
jgi:hypothetical protein